MEAQADRARGVDRVVKPAAIGIQVKMIAGCRTSRKHQLGHRDARRHVEHFRCDPRPERVVRAQPSEKIGVLCCRDSAGQRLEEMMVRVDESRQHDLAAAVDHFVGYRRQFSGASDGDDGMAAYVDASADDFAAHLVHRRDQRRISE